jgi:hypothetical protein
VGKRERERELKSPSLGRAMGLMLKTNAFFSDIPSVNSKDDVCFLLSSLSLSSLSLSLLLSLSPTSLFSFG